MLFPCICEQLILEDNQQAVQPLLFPFVPILTPISKLSSSYCTVSFTCTVPVSILLNLLYIYVTRVTKAPCVRRGCSVEPHFPVKPALPITRGNLMVVLFGDLLTRRIPGDGQVRYTILQQDRANIICINCIYITHYLIASQSLYYSLPYYLIVRHNLMCCSFVSFI